MMLACYGEEMRGEACGGLFSLFAQLICVVVCRARRCEAQVWNQLSYMSVYTNGRAVLLL
jgi:hypothetical protein